MSLSRVFLSLIATPLKIYRRHRPRKSPTDPRILVIRRNRMGDMIYTLPLLHSLRRHFPEMHLTVACDPVGAPIAQSCAAVNEVIVLQTGWNPWWAALRNAARLQNFDWVIAAKGGFDRRLAVLTRLTNAVIRIGFVKRSNHTSACFTDPVAPPDKPFDEHQIETLLRLLNPLGMVHISNHALDLSLKVPEPSRQFATDFVSQLSSPRIVAMNISSTVPLKFRDEDFVELASHILAESGFTVVFVGAPADQAKAAGLAAHMNSERVVSLATTGPLDLAAILEKSTFLFTPEGGAAHLAAAVGTPALVLWSEGPFNKWHSRGANHAFVHAESREKFVPVERVWQALQPFLTQKKG